MSLDKKNLSDSSNNISTSFFIGSEQKDEALEKLKDSLSHQRRGKLKIYLGMAPGVGKTFAMLSDARLDLKKGVDLIAGYVEPHGRIDTEELTKTLELLPFRDVTYNGVKIYEFDLDAAIKRKPAVILIDELAHTNIPNSRHEKRYQDIDELLDQGIDVRTTVNIQHLESLKDIIQNITGVKVQESVPDIFFIAADEVEVIDTPPNELIQRLKDGKIYTPDKIERALNNFFKEGNLYALRELVLRQTADKVSADVWRYRTENSVKQIWATKERVLVCVAPDALSSQVVREARRLATVVNGELYALSIETPKYSALSKNAREKAEAALELASKLGAEVIVRSAVEIVPEIIAVARELNINQIVLGKPPKRKLINRFFKSTLDALVENSGEIGVHFVSIGGDREIKLVSRERLQKKQLFTFQNFFHAIIAALITTIIAFPLSSYLAPTNILMLYLIGVTWSATRGGRTTPILTSIFGVLAFDFFFVPPFYTFRVSDVEYLVSFIVMILVGVVIASITARLNSHILLIAEREKKTSILYEFLKSLSKTNSTAEIGSCLISHFKKSFGLNAVLLIPNKDSRILKFKLIPVETEIDDKSLSVAAWCFENTVPAGKNTNTLQGASGSFFPLFTPKACYGVIAVIPEITLLDKDKKQIFETFCTNTALSLERIKSDEIAQGSALMIEEERLRNSFLSSISHDLRTPLASIHGAGSALSQRLVKESDLELAETIVSQSDRLSRMIRNILDTIKLEGGTVNLKKDWQAIEELIGVAIRRTKVVIQNRKIKTKIDSELPLLFIDGLLIEQVFINLLENIGNHTSENTSVEIDARIDESGSCSITISDDGEGIPAEIFPNIFNRIRNDELTNKQSNGLGLSICKTIIKAHDGEIACFQRVPHGTIIKILLPVTRKI